MSTNIKAGSPSEKGGSGTLNTLQDRVRMNIDRAAVNEFHTLDRTTVVRLLNDGLAAEIACLQHCHSRHYAYMELATTVKAPDVAAACLEHGAEEKRHADLLTERILELGGEPDLDPSLERGHEYARCVGIEDPAEMIREDLMAERRVIDGYTEMIHYIGDDDPRTRKLLLEILADEERHVLELDRLLCAHGV